MLIYTVYESHRWRTPSYCNIWSHI